MKKTVALFIVVLCLSLLVSCSKVSSTSAFVGTWTLESGKTDVKSITFYSDGTCVVDNDETGEWSVVDGTLKVLGPYGGQFFSHDNIIGQYNIKSNTLTIKDARIDGDYTDTLVYKQN